MTVSNCARCRRLFQKTHDAVCPACLKVVQQQRTEIEHVLQQVSQITLDALAQQCGLPLKEMERLLFEGRLGRDSYKVMCLCQQCGRSVGGAERRGHFCLACAGKVESKPNRPSESLGSTGESVSEPPASAVSRSPSRQDRPERPEKALGEERPSSPSSKQQASKQQEPVEIQTESYGFKRRSE